MSNYRKKLIEVALPLDAINKESAREKSIRHGHPSTLHLWWARRPLAACRAVLFSSLVNDPDDDPMYGISEDTAATERAKLFDLIEELVKWENSNNPRVINAARLEIARSIAANKVADGELEDDTPLVADAPELPEEQEKYLPDPPPEYTAHDVRFKMPGLKPEQVNHFLAHYAPPVLDPFAGGGSIPLEAQRLGLRAYASDLNPVPVLINKALIEIPPKFAGQPPVNPKWQSKSDAEKAVTTWKGAQGLAEDVRYYGKWMRDEAEKRIGHLYPKVTVTEEMAADRTDLEPYVGQELTVISWIWARTVICPNPACRKHMPLASSFWLSKRKSMLTWMRPTIEDGKLCFRVEQGENGGPPDGTVDRRGVICLFCGSHTSLPYVREEGLNDRFGLELISIVCQGNRRRLFFEPMSSHVSAAECCPPDELLQSNLPESALGFRVHLYGLSTHRSLFSPRQLFSLNVLSELVTEAAKHIETDIGESHHKGDIADEYRRAIVTYLAMSVSKAADLASALCHWQANAEQLKLAPTFTRPTMSMTWDFAEGNLLSDYTGNYFRQIELISKVLEASPDGHPGVAIQHDANKEFPIPNLLVSTDPPYYDNIGYADLSDFFYVWLREKLKTEYPELFGTLLVPKQPELVSDPARHGGKSKSRKFFEDGLRNVFEWITTSQDSSFPVTVFYAFKQTETEKKGKGDAAYASTGWETMLSSLISSGLMICGTWPVRTERSGRPRGNASNALASSVVLVCRPRLDGDQVTRRDFANALRKELPEAIKHLQLGNVAPVDLAQASIGPGMAVFSRYSKVVNADGSPMSVREALQFINQVLDESLAEQESEFDADTRFALRWFEQYGMDDGPFGDAETLSKAMAVSVNGVVEAGILKAGAGKVRLLKRDELVDDWDPMTDSRLVVWEVTQYLIRTLERDGEMATAALFGKVGSLAEVARDLAYRLYATCERKKLAQEALAYNSLVIAWPEISRLARQVRSETTTETQQSLFED